MRNSDASNVCVGDLARAASVPRNAGYFVLHRVRARGLRHDDRSSRPRPRASSASTLRCACVAELLGVAGVEPRHPAADLTLGQIAREPVALEHADHRLADRRAPGTRRGRSGTARPRHARGAEPSVVRRGTTSRTAPRRTWAAAGRGDARDLLHEARARASRWSVAFTTGASVVATLPWRSVRASSRALERRLLPSRRAAIDSERSISCGKSIRHSCC